MQSQLHTGIPMTLSPHVKLTPRVATKASTPRFHVSSRRTVSIAAVATSPSTPVDTATSGYGANDTSSIHSFGLAQFSCATMRAVFPSSTVDPVTSVVYDGRFSSAKEDMLVPMPASSWISSAGPSRTVILSQFLPQASRSLQASCGLSILILWYSH